MTRRGMVREIKNQSQADLDQFAHVEEVFERGAQPFAEKIDAFPAYASRQALARFLAKARIFEKVLNVNGSIVECGVLHGAGLMSFAKLSSILEPVNYTRKIIGFDTFDGFPSIDDVDRQGDSSHLEVGALRGASRDDVEALVELYDLNRPLNHISKVELVPGDLTETAPQFLRDNPHLVVALLYLDVDLHEPTRVALETFIPRMPKGAIVAFDQLNGKMFPGETAAVDEVLGLANVRIERFYFEPFISYCVIE